MDLTHELVRAARKKSCLSPEVFAGHAGIDPSVYGTFEAGTGFLLPAQLKTVAGTLGIPLSEVIGDDLLALTEQQDAAGMFDPKKMHTYLRGYFEAMRWDDALSALAFARKMHAGQKRKGGQPYIIHPLSITCHALALGIREEAVAAASLLHDVPEDCGVSYNDIPVRAPETKDAVRRLTHMPGVPLEVYYRDIAGSPVSSVVKILDRCDNVSTMAGVFTDAKTLGYIDETREFVMPLWRTTKDMWPQYADALFVLKYHILSIVNGLDACIRSDGEDA